MNKKRFFSGISSAVLILGSLSPMQVFAQSEEPAMFFESAEITVPKTYFGKNNSATWEIKNGVLKIEGSFQYEGSDAQTFVPWPWAQSLDGDENAYRNSIKKVEFGSGFTLTGSAAGMFQKMHNLEEIDFSNFMTEKLTSMYSMFCQCESLKSLDLSNLNTSEVMNMQSVFNTCNSLSTIDISTFNTEKALTMHAMFAHCTNLNSINLGSLNTSDVSNMMTMFYDCSSLKSIDLSSFDTQKVTSMESMFYGCKDLKSIDLSSFKTPLVTKFTRMFGGCTGLTYLDLTPLTIAKNQNTNQYPDITQMFLNDTNLQAVKIDKESQQVLDPLEDIHSKWHVDKQGPYTVNEIKDLMAGKEDALLEISVDYSLGYSGNASDASNIPAGAKASSSNGKCQFTVAEGMPERPGYTFLGWADTSNATKATYHAGNTVTVSLNTNGQHKTLYAVWRRNSSSGSGSSSSGSVARSSVHEMHRMYNPNSGEHFYTKEIAERDHLVNVGWQYEGTAWYSPKSSGSPVYRLYNPNAGDHHYTLSASERDELVRVGWKDEGIGWYSANSRDGQAVHRQYNPNAVAGSHNFTTDEYERDYLINNGWNHEGVAWYGVHPKNIKK